MPTARGGQVRQILDREAAGRNEQSWRTIGANLSLPPLRLTVATGTLVGTICTARCSVPIVKATWEITITCRDASRLRFSELRGDPPCKGEIVQTVGGGPIIKAKIESFHEQPKAGAGPALFQVKATEI